MDNVPDYLLIREIVSSFFILLGVVFMLIASIGLLRFPDFYIRMSAITKGATLGVGLILLGMAIYFNQADMYFKVVVIITFTFITAPVAAHVIARTAVHSKVPFWKPTNLKAFQDYLKKEVRIKEKGEIKK
ncbi:monovalent cation/H(+) antiporter subunit G [Cesiribacter andamanensis]|uniref:Multiple resistance and pH homeostasis protein G n=1 Tax=Cesiribacter andamanensis AMV16 TaxID=1279009 RepID=M7NTQ3_9BACT|nr:monovalent cation/H(+) antiporter subunit G [Cesiribacter andamanensis]EMR01844.1 Multiple resistance and pH homeostasis protein G [Cesiribacter andamanensis AMV16]